MPPAVPPPPPVPASLQRAWRRRLRGLIRDADFADPFSTGRDQTDSDEAPFWALEPTPLVLEAAEWAALEEGLRQRARFVNLLLVDLHDRQKVLL